MIIALGKVFDLNISKSVANGIIKSAAATFIGRTASQLLVGWVPVVGNAINTATAAGITEAIGWMTVKEFSENSNKFQKINYQDKTEAEDKRGWKRPMVLIEPGRYVVGNAGITLYNVGAVKDIPGIRKYVSVDGGMSDNIRTALYGAKYEGLLANRAEEEPSETVRVTGKICESGDVLIDEIKLPKVNYGDILAVFSTGEYHYTMSSNYNQLPKPAIVFTYKGKAGGQKAEF